MFKAFLPSGIARVPIKTQGIKCRLAFSWQLVSQSALVINPIPKLVPIA